MNHTWVHVVFIHYLNVIILALVFSKLENIRRAKVRIVEFVRVVEQPFHAGHISVMLKNKWHITSYIYNSAKKIKALARNDFPFKLHRVPYCHKHYINA